MIYLFLIAIILFLSYVAFFTPEKRNQREIRRVQKLFNTPISGFPIFKIDDLRNETHPDETVMYEFSNGEKRLSHRKLAELTYRLEEQNNKFDEDYAKAKEIVLKNKEVSISLLISEMKVDYEHAWKLFNSLHERGEIAEELFVGELKQ